MPRVDRKVDEHGLQLRPIGHECVQTRDAADTQPDCGTERRGEQIAQALEQRPSLHALRVQLSPARKRQEPAGDRNAACHRLPRAQGELAHLVRPVRPALQKVKTAHHSLQHVVEIMRDPAGELAERLQTLRLGQLRLGLLAGLDLPPHLGFEIGVEILQAFLGGVQLQLGPAALGHIDQHAGQPRILPGAGIGRVAPDTAEPSDIAVWQDGAELRLVIGMPAQARLADNAREFTCPGHTILWMQQRLEVGGAAYRPIRPAKKR